ncbi:hypothetical protein OG689_31310 [Kitasatospora sp. NBC_00240]|uniref:hypothetical protein n=1 Tax=Kitasatospora sp. NBC_00240 TaxID=2903567 RepID=UPI0022556229|nr:hypothetical protein [Kitasatospora sp. NBC_00240]MCX5213706.1 hypothetical protein [Kitasatospora sp. NBC_00240]
MNLKRLARVGLALAASAIMVAGLEGSASASGLNVSVNKSWGSSTFYPDGDWLYSTDLSADGYSVHGKIQQLVCADVGCDGYTWQDLRTGCHDTTSIGDNGSEIRQCNYDITENLTVRVCEARYSDGTRYGDWYCSNETKS